MKDQESLFEKCMINCPVQKVGMMGTKLCSVTDDEECSKSNCLLMHLIKTLGKGNYK